MLKFALIIMMYAVGIAYSTYMKEKVFEQWYALNGPYGQERISNHTHNYDNVASGGVLNPTELGSYGDTPYKLTYNTFGEFKHPYSYMLPESFFYVIFGADFRKSCRKSDGIVPNSWNSSQQQPEYRLLWRRQRIIVGKQASEDLDPKYLLLR